MRCTPGRSADQVSSIFVQHKLTHCESCIGRMYYHSTNSQARTLTLLKKEYVDTIQLKSQFIAAKMELGLQNHNSNY